MTDRDQLRAVVEAGERLLSGDGVGVVEQLRRAVDAGRAHLASTIEPRCSCGTPGLDYEGPEVDCDVHGSPSEAFAAGRREGAQDERDQARIRGDLCRWCRREPQRDERHGVSIPGSTWGQDPEVACLGVDGAPVLDESARDDPFGGALGGATILARDAARRERAAYAAGRAAGAEAKP